MALNHAEIRARKQEIIAEMRKQFPALQIATNGTDKIGFRHYVPCVYRSSVIVRVETQWITSKYSCESISRYYIQPDAARAAITAILPQAETKRKELVAALEAVRALGCDFGTTMLGDTEGIWDSFDYVEFEIDGFSFHYEV